MQVTLTGLQELCFNRSRTRPYVFEETYFESATPGVLIRLDVFHTSMTLSNVGMAGRWDDLFSTRKTLRYGPEDNKILSTPANSIIDRKKLISKIFVPNSNHLQPPNAFKYPALHRFFQESSQKVRLLPSISGEIVLLDERNDPKGDGKTPRAWDSTGEDGYLGYPPTGVQKTSKAMQLPELLEILSDSVSPS